MLEAEEGIPDVCHLASTRLLVPTNATLAPLTSIISGPQLPCKPARNICEQMAIQHLQQEVFTYCLILFIGGCWKFNLHPCACKASILLLNYGPTWVWTLGTWFKCDAGDAEFHTSHIFF